MTDRRFCSRVLPPPVVVHIVDPSGRALCGAVFALASQAATDATCPVCRSAAAHPSRRQP